MKYLVFRIFLIQQFGLQLNLFLRKRQILFITSHMLFIFLQINSTDTIGTELNLFAGAELGNSDCTVSRQSNCWQYNSQCFVPSIKSIFYNSKFQYFFSRSLLNITRLAETQHCTKIRYA